MDQRSRLRGHASQTPFILKVFISIQDFSMLHHTWCRNELGKLAYYNVKNMAWVLKWCRTLQFWIGTILEVYLVT